MRGKFFLRNHLLYIRIKAKGVPNIPIILSLYALIECMEAWKDTYSILSCLIPSLRLDKKIGKVAVFFYVLQSIETLLQELGTMHEKELVTVDVPKDHVFVSIRLL